MHIIIRQYYLLKCTLQNAFDFSYLNAHQITLILLKVSLLLMLFILSSHNTNIRFLFLQFNHTLDNTTQPHQCNLPFQSAFFHELAYVGYILLSNFTILMYSNILSSLLFLSFHKNKCVIIYAYYACTYHMMRMKPRTYNNAPKSQEIKCTIL